MDNLFQIFVMGLLVLSLSYSFAKRLWTESLSIIAAMFWLGWSMFNVFTEPKSVSIRLPDLFMLIIMSLIVSSREDRRQPKIDREQGMYKQKNRRI